MKKFITIFSAVLFVATLTARAQFIEDALRFSQHYGYITPRAGGLGVAYNGVSDDFGALAYNPAGLSLIAKNELSIGFGFLRNNSQTDFLNNIQKLSSNDGFLSHLGIVVPFKTAAGTAAIGIGYMLEDTYNNNLQYSGFNKNSTLIAAEASNSAVPLDQNFAYELYLAGSDLRTPVRDSLQQNAFISEKGGMHNITGGAAFDLSKMLAIGFTITGKWGNYSYSRNYTEEDTYNKYRVYDTNLTDVDFNKLTLNENLNQDVRGITGSLGLQVRVADFMRIGATIKFPTYYHVDETFGRDADVQVDDGTHVISRTSLANGDTITTGYKDNGTNGYNISTPFVYSAGFSLHAANITFTAGVEYSDVTQLQFTDDSGMPQLEQLNRDIIKDLVGQTTWGVGVEYDIPLMPIVVRGSFSSSTSPYSQDIGGAYFQTVALGGGIYLANNIRLDGVFRWSNLSELRSNYYNYINPALSSSYKLSISPLDIGFQLTYRY